MIDIKKLKHTGAVALPSLFTIGNMGCGFFSLLATTDKKFTMAAWLIIGAMVMDALDGRIARMVHGESDFGVEIDSLADCLSFGVAPAFLMFQFLLKDFGFWGYPIAFIYALCGMLRLARFNVMANEGKGSKKYFSGLPIPAAAGILASFVLAYSMLEMNTNVHSMKILIRQLPIIYNMIPFIMLGLAFLMVSTIKFAAFKQANVLKPKTLKGMIFVVALGFILVAYPQDAIFLVFSFYVLAGVLAFMWRIIRMLSGKETNLEGDTPPPPPDAQ